MKRITDICYKIMLIVLFILITYVVYCSIFNIYNSVVELKAIIIIIGTIVALMTFINLRKIIKKIPESKSNYFAIGICIVFFIVLIISGNVITSIPTYDLSNIEKEAESMIQNGGNFVTDTYFSIYPSQGPLTILVYYIYRIGSILNFSNLKHFAIIINSLFIAITAFFTYLSAKKISNYKNGLITLLFFVINPIFYMYASYFYSDILCMPFAMIAIYMFTIARTCNNTTKSMILQVLATIILILGFKIRVVLIFILLATLISIIMNNKEIKKITINIGSIIIGAVLGLCIFTLITTNFNIPENENLKFPITHWIMMGLNVESDGKWNIEDYKYTYNCKTYSEKEEKNIDIIKQRINELKSDGLIELFKTKIAVTWSNGSYDYISKLINSEKINNLYSYICGNRKIFMLYYCQICKVAVLVAFLFAIIKEYRSSDKKYDIIFITMLGAFAFYLIWEVLSRYSLTFLPLMILLFGIGISEIEKLLYIKKVNVTLNDNTNIHINIERVNKIFMNGILIITVILLGINFSKYTIKENTNWDIRAMQYSSDGNYSPTIANKKIKQTFTVNKTFNSIAIKFKTNKVKSETHYIFKLKNNEGEELVKNNFTSKEIENDKLKVFRFENIKVDKDTKFIIEIYSEDAKEDDTLAIATFYLKGYSAYPNGELYIDNEKSEADLTFQVQNEVKRPYTSKKVYILLSLIIISLEIFALYPFLKRDKKVDVKGLEEGGTK